MNGLPNLIKSFKISANITTKIGNDVSITSTSLSMTISVFQLDSFIPKLEHTGFIFHQFSFLAVIEIKRSNQFYETIMQLKQMHFSSNQNMY